MRPDLADLPAPVARPLPENLRETLAATDMAIATIERAWPASLERARAAVARTGPAERQAEAEVQASRFEALFQPLAGLDETVARLESLLPDAIGGEGYLADVAALRRRIRALEEVRSRSILP